jgi:hypothetical protein
MRAHRSSRRIVLLSVVLAACDSTTEPQAGPPAQIERVAGNDQMGEAGKPVSELLAVRLRDRDGNPVPNATVVWDVTAGGGQLSPTRATTDRTGRAAVQWTLGPSAGPQRATAAAASDGTDSLRVTFEATGTCARTRAAGIYIIAGEGLTDTIQGATKPLVVQVIPPGTGRCSGTTVRLTAPPSDVDDRTGIEFVVPSSPVSAHEVADTTDVEGKLTAEVHFGTRARSYLVTATATELGGTATTNVVVLPGNAVTLRAAPGDTALYQGASYSIRTTVLDRFENLREDVPTYSGSAHTSVDASGRVTAGSSYARGFTTVRAADLVATAWVSIVPRGTLAVTLAGYSVARGVAVVNVDGSGYRLLVDVNDQQASYLWPAWSPQGDRIVYNARDPRSSRLFTTDMAGSVRTASALTTPNSTEIWGRYSPDGTWIYYSGGTQYPDLDLWRVRADGSGTAEAIGPPMPPGSGRQWHSAPSPDGTKLVFSNGGYGLQVLDIATGAATTIVGAFGADAPRYSPAGDLIAFTFEFDRSIRIVRPDGTGQRTLTRPDDWYSDWDLDWSADGAWVIARSWGFRLNLIRVADGLVLPLPYSGDFYQPSWRPAVP